MCVSVTSTTPDATDLGFLLHKHPDRVRSVDVGFGIAHVFYPEANSQRCTATLFVDVDPISLSRKRKGAPTQGLEPYVNDRPYAASSMLSVAIGKLFGTAMAGSCDTRPELVARQLDLEIALPVVPVRGGEDMARRMFEPLGYVVESTSIPLDNEFPSWGDSAYRSVRLVGSQTVRRALEHLFVLLPVLDDRKHYWIGQDEVAKLLRRGGDWLPAHPEATAITRRYLRFGSLTQQVLTQLAENNTATEETDEQNDTAEAAVERPLSLNAQRLDAVVGAVVSAGGGRVVDLGCGEGRLLQRLMSEKSVSYLLGMDVSIGALSRAAKRLNIEDMSERQRERIEIKQGALTYTDARIVGFDVATVIEVIEHLDLERLDAFVQILFGYAVPSTVIVTTPNREYNVHFERLGTTGLRHGDHRFEWTRAEFGAWVDAVSETYGYETELFPIGAFDPVVGSPTQMCVFRRVPDVAATPGEES